MADRDSEVARTQSGGPRLYRPRKGRIIAGVCAGIARYFGWSATPVRIAYIVISVLSAAFPGILAYVILWLLMPGDPAGPRSFRLD